MRPYEHEAPRWRAFVEKKLAVNKKRTWKPPNAEGWQSHVGLDTSTLTPDEGSE